MVIGITVLLALLFAGSGAVRAGELPGAHPPDDAGRRSLEIELLPNLGHRSSVSKVAVSGDGRWVLSGDDKGGLNLWDADRRRLLRSIKGHTDEVTSIEFLPDGRRALSASDSSDTLTMWDLVSGRPLLRFELPLFSAHPLSVTPDGSLAVVESGDKLLLLDLESGEIVHDFGGHKGEIIDVELAGDGTFTYALHEQGSVSVWNTKSGALLRQQGLPPDPTFEGYPTALAVSPDGSRLAVTRGDNLYLLTQGKRKPSVVTSEAREFDYPGDVAFFSAGTTLAVQYQHRVEILDFKTGTVKTTCASGTELGQLKRDNIALLPGGQGFVTASGTGISVCAVDASGVRESRFEVSTRPLDFVGVIPAGSGGTPLIFTGGERAAGISIWDSATGRLLRTLPREGLRWAELTPDGRSLVAAGSGRSATFQVYDQVKEAWKDDDFAQPDSADKGYLTFRSIDAMTVSNDGARVILGVSDIEGPIALEAWSVETGDLLARLRIGAEDRVTALATLPDGERLISVHRSDKLVLRELETLQPVAEKTLTGVLSGDIALNQAGTRAYVGAGPDLVLFDVDSLSPVNRLRLPSWNHAIVYAGRGDDVITGGNEPHVRRWDAALGEDRQVFVGHIGSVEDLAVVGDRLFSVGDDGTLRHWNLETAELLATSISDTAGEWMTITPDGYLVSSESGLDLLSVVQGRELHQIEAFAHELRRPGLVREQLRGDPEGKVARAAADLDLRKVLESGPAPGLEIVNIADGEAFEEVPGADVEERLVPVRVAVTDRGGGVGRVEWRVGPERQLYRSELVGVSEKGARVEREGIVPVEDLETLVEVIAFNGKGLVAERRQIVVTATPASFSELPRLFVVAVGVGAYPEESLKLNSPKWDVLALERALRSAEGKLFVEVIFESLIDGDATAERIGSVFEEMGQEVLPRDSFVFYVSAHGKAVDDELYVLPGDFRRSITETPVEAIVRQGIGRRHLQAWFQQIRARKRLEIYDTCNAAALANRPPPVAKSYDENVLLDAARRMKLATGNPQIFATQPQDIAIDGFHQLGHSLLTYVLLEALVFGDTTRDDRIDLLELESYLDRRVRELGESEFRTAQTPRVDTDTVENKGGYFLASKLARLPDLSAERAAEPARFRPSHVVIAPADLSPHRDGVAAGEPLAVGEFVSVVRNRKSDGWALVERKSDGIAGWADPAHLIPLPSR